jgi:hypothetical protein
MVVDADGALAIVGDLRRPCPKRDRLLRKLILGLAGNRSQSGTKIAAARNNPGDTLFAAAQPRRRSTARFGFAWRAPRRIGHGRRQGHLLVSRWRWARTPQEASVTSARCHRQAGDEIPHRPSAHARSRRAPAHRPLRVASGLAAGAARGRAVASSRECARRDDRAGAAEVRRRVRRAR